jgi:hypothetical protein
MRSSQLKIQHQKILLLDGRATVRSRFFDSAHDASETGFAFCPPLTTVCGRIGPKSEFQRGKIQTSWNAEKHLQPMINSPTPQTSFATASAERPAAIPPSFYPLPQRGHDPHFGLGRSSYYDLERRGLLRLVRIRKPGNIRGKVLVPYSETAALLRKLGAGAEATRCETASEGAAPTAGHAKCQ